MRARGRAPHLCLALALSGLPVAAGGAPASLSAELSRCAALAAAAERLACYDALACTTSTAADQRAACRDALAPGKPVPSPGAALPAGPGPAAAHASFGTVTRAAPPKPQGPDQIQAVVTKLDVDRRGNVSVSLDNGQLWTFRDPDALLRAGDTVTIRRAALGSFLLTTAARRTYRVQRME